MSAKKARYTYDRHALYESAVQNVEADVDFIERVVEAIHGRPARLLREDFCGSAALAAEWVRRHDDNRAWGVDLDLDTLEWGREHRVAPLGDAASRVHLRCGDVRATRGPKVEVQVAFNFSFCVFQERSELAGYLRSVHRLLRPGGLFMVDLFGGTESLLELEEDTRRPKTQEPDGRWVPPLVYTWEQETFNAIDHHFVGHITLEYEKKGKKKRLERAFSYDWRLWTLPELRDLLAEAGFEWTQVYAEGWDDEADEADGNFELTDHLDNEGGWVVYVVAKKPE